MTAAAAQSTFLLDQQSWDFVIDAAGNIAIASPPYSTAQDVCSAIRTFLGEVWFDSTVGVPYLQKILGHAPPLTYLQAQLVAAAETVPGVVNASCVIESVVGRKVTGQVTWNGGSVAI